MSKFLPTCRKCYKPNSVKIADAGIFKSIPYYYCTNCKIEVDSAGYEVKTQISKSEFKELEDYFSEQLIKMDQESPDPFKDFDYELFDFTDDDEEDLTPHILYPYKFTL